MTISTKKPLLTIYPMPIAYNMYTTTNGTHSTSYKSFIS